jgi:hypothetical protein
MANRRKLTLIEEKIREFNRALYRSFTQSRPQRGCKLQQIGRHIAIFQHLALPIDRPGSDIRHFGL